MTVICAKTEAHLSKKAHLDSGRAKIQPRVHSLTNYHASKFLEEGMAGGNYIYYFYTKFLNQKKKALKEMYQKKT